jgi:hypothetical protein
MQRKVGSGYGRTIRVQPQTIRHKPSNTFHWIVWRYNEPDTRHSIPHTIGQSRSNLGLLGQVMDWPTPYIGLTVVLQDRTTTLV